MAIPIIPIRKGFKTSMIILIIAFAVTMIIISHDQFQGEPVKAVNVTKLFEQFDSQDDQWKTLISGLNEDTNIEMQIEKISNEKLVTPYFVLVRSTSCFYSL